VPRSDSWYARYDRPVRRLRVWALGAVLAGTAALVIISSVDAAPSAKSLVGTWSGFLTQVGGGHPARQHFTMVVYRGERAGTWRLNAHCSGKLRLKDISNGYHHYYRMAGANPGCIVLGVDCFQRDGARMEDAFVPDAAAEAPNANGKFRRVS
jgi:hypothetical protein